MPDAPGPGFGAEARPFGLSLRFEAAARLAAEAHRGQERRCSRTPYVEHPYAVALILDRAGFAEDVVIAGLLHDVVEDTAVTLAEVEAGFGPDVAALVAACSEEKLDAAGHKRPWADRKRDHLAVIHAASPEAQAVALADKLHNLLAIEVDLAAGRPVWGEFHAPRADVLAYYRSAIDACGGPDPRLAPLAEACRRQLARVAG